MTNEDINNLIINNQNLAYSLLNKYYKKSNHLIDYEDLKSIALLGLVKAANTFNINKNVKFSSYAYIVIENEILLNLNNEVKLTKVESLDKNIKDKVTFLDLLGSNDFIEDTYILKEQINYLYCFIDDIKEDNIKNILLLTIDGLNQQEIANKLNISQSLVSQLYHKGLNILRNRFDNIGD